MDDRRLKRQLIERGHLKAWARRGNSHRMENLRLLRPTLKAALRLTGLRSQGKRNALSPVLRHLRLTFDNLPAAFSGFTILHLTDIHADGVEGLAEPLHACLEGLEVDLCVLTGDYRFGIRGSCERVYPNMERILEGINARRGVVGILGNHDVSEMVPEFERMGVTMLLNEALEIQSGGHSLWLVGLDDPHYYGCDDLPGAVAGVPGEAFKILLVHTPELFEEAHRHGMHLYLCGHTHGGQICLPVIGPLITHSNSPRKYVRGIWQHKGVIGYTNSGLGCSGVAARFFCPPEIVIIELCAAQTSAAPEASSQTVLRQGSMATVERV